MAKRNQIIELRFECGCKGYASGLEKDRPRCEEHQSPIRRVTAPRPRVRGSVASPLKVD